jgi:hypothetical protein
MAKVENSHAIMMTKYGILFLLLLILSCGRSPEDDSGGQNEEDTDTEGIYTATLAPVNSRVNNKVTGLIKIYHSGDEFRVIVVLKNASSGIHKQQLHTGSVCPSSMADENRDGFIDNYESLKIMGHIIVPFDGDLSSQDLGRSYWPSGSHYNYEQSTSYQLMLADLHQFDPIPNDSVVKLDEQHLPLDMRVVSVYGNSAQGEVPIACGILARISNTPEEEDWEERVPPRQSPAPPRRPPAPEPEYNPPDPEVDEEEHSGGWWDRMRQRWRRWRNRGNGQPNESTEGDTYI